MRSIGGRPWGRAIALAVGVVVLGTLFATVGSGGIARAAPAPDANAPSATWAYGGVGTIHFSGVSRAGIPYVGNLTDGFTVELAQQNVSGSSFSLNVTRTSGAAFAIEYCTPNCQTPVYRSALQARFWESDRTVSVLTTTGAVNESGGPVAAIALESSTTVTRANETESTSSYLPVAGSVPVARSAYLSAEIFSNSSVTFSRPLGILPENLTDSQGWSSEASFRSTGETGYRYFLGRSGAATGSLSGSGSLPLPSNGTESLLGAYSSANSIRLGGVPFPEIALAPSGPFGLVDGIVLVPTGAQLFGTTTARPWAGNESGAVNAGMSYLDVRTGDRAHFGVGASRWVFGLQTLEPTYATAVSASGLTDLAGTGTPDAPAQTAVQGEPQSPTQSAAVQGCLLYGSACPGAGLPTASTLRDLVGPAVAVAGVGTVVAMVAVVAVRRRLPPHVYPNAPLYPPGGPTTGRAGPHDPTPPAPPDSEDDPLGHLW